MPACASACGLTFSMLYRGKTHTAEPPKQLAADMAAAREDQELQEKAAAERRSIPSTIDGFR